MNQKQHKTDNIHSVMLFVLVLIIIGVIAVFTVLSQNRMEKQAGYYLEQNVDRITSEIDSYMSSAENSIRLTSYLVSQTMSGPRLENASEVIRSTVEQTIFDKIVYIDVDGKTAMNQGEIVDVSKRVYYRDGIEGNTGIWIEYKTDNEAKENTKKQAEHQVESIIHVYTPLYYKKNVVGVLNGSINADDNLLPLLESSFFGKKVAVALYDEDTHIITTSLETKGATTAQDLLDNSSIATEGKELFTERFYGNDTSAFEYYDMAGKGIACCINDQQLGWRIVQIVPTASFKEVMRQSTSGAYAATAVISVALLLYLIFLRIDSKKRHSELLEETDRMAMNYGHILMATAADAYIGIRRVDLATGQSDFLYFKDGTLQETVVGEWSEWLEGQRKNVHTDDYEKLKDTFHLDQLRLLENGAAKQCSFRSKEKNEAGYYNLYTTTASVTEMDGKKTALLTTVDSTAAVRTELEQKKLLASASSIYISMHALDFVADTVEALNSADHIDSVVADRRFGVREILTGTMAKFTDEQHMDVMMEFINLDTLDERMEGTNTITLEFIGTVSGWCRARFVAVEYDDHHHLSKVLWVVENINAEKKKSNHLQYLSETDLMTGIRNRGSGEKRIKDLIASDKEGMFCVMDVDKFKAFNDNYGHKVGDQVLIEIANCLKDCFRETDVVMRLGGDEFAVFAKDVLTEELAATLFQRLFERINAIDIPEITDHVISISIGAAFKTVNDGVDFETLYKNADSCTYKSKKITGNAYTFYE